MVLILRLLLERSLCLINMHIIIIINIQSFKLGSLKLSTNPFTAVTNTVIFQTYLSKPTLVKHTSAYEFHCCFVSPLDKIYQLLH